MFNNASISSVVHPYYGEGIPSPKDFTGVSQESPVPTIPLRDTAGRPECSHDGTTRFPLSSYLAAKIAKGIFIADYGGNSQDNYREFLIAACFFKIGSTEEAPERFWTWLNWDFLADGKFPSRCGKGTDPSVAFVGCEWYGPVMGYVYARILELEDDDDLKRTSLELWRPAKFQVPTPLSVGTVLRSLAQCDPLYGDRVLRKGKATFAEKKFVELAEDLFDQDQLPGLKKGTTLSNFLARFLHSKASRVRDNFTTGKKRYKDESTGMTSEEVHSVLEKVHEAIDLVVKHTLILTDGYERSEEAKANERARGKKTGQTKSVNNKADRDVQKGNMEKALTDLAKLVGLNSVQLSERLKGDALEKDRDLMFHLFELHDNGNLVPSMSGIRFTNLAIAVFNRDGDYTYERDRNYRILQHVFTFGDTIELTEPYKHLSSPTRRQVSKFKNLFEKLQAHRETDSYKAAIEASRAESKPASNKKTGKPGRKSASNEKTGKTTSKSTGKAKAGKKTNPKPDSVIKSPVAKRQNVGRGKSEDEVELVKSVEKMELESEEENEYESEEDDTDEEATSNKRGKGRRGDPNKHMHNNDDDDLDWEPGTH